MTRFRVSKGRWPAVEAFLKGEDVIHLAPVAARTPPAVFRTSRRSNDLWLLFD